MPPVEFALGIQLGVALLAVALGGWVHGALGVGFPLVATPLIALVVDVKTAILLTLAPTMAVNIVSMIEGGRWSESLGRYWPVAVFVLIGSIVGTKLLIVSDPAPFKLVLALLILFYLFSGSVLRLDWHWIRRHSSLAMAGFGFLGGVAAGTVNVAVPILIIYFSEMQLASLALVQILNLCFFAGKIAQVGTFGLSGQLSQSIFLMSLLLAAVAILALTQGIKIRRRVHGETYRNWLRGMLFVVVCVLVVQYVGS